MALFASLRRISSLVGGIIINHLASDSMLTSRVIMYLGTGVDKVGVVEEQGGH